MKIYSISSIEKRLDEYFYISYRTAEVAAITELSHPHFKKRCLASVNEADYNKLLQFFKSVVIKKKKQKVPNKPTSFNKPQQGGPTSYFSYFEFEESMKPNGRDEVQYGVTILQLL
ncbi:hypothetical protein ABEB36_013772 [Hypothenemus hampei]|uniref:Uncharacterized protein n=1 Tax=Hypothenemus hampei TaxID=57062 RepID=A0ABD1E5J3_HYPHA